ncbi:NAD(P)-dependent dehydrogenase (short-subunit alcohol dehydrogenase family) [Sphingobium sp. OAS761]|jgi:NAD(P)-dependent dehydrogenase (short-subunit alcohol dehydrogenase family)|uniref:SDR family NAD(P)-dependent oxidoreductase n=1 Tax=Sphingobium sp. OAS761 TaxID=2817901 RepID=UPI00209FF9C4|nr:SDR family NAD(P)-dependent oxidoreductase [Sphingobium sp. OAS761]MCP1470189.1 NAD(P)-dependent dehydrogenase (short-subunit alcohol dehydrogenase family) [Sphingobium sp. OAS761]
MAILEGKTILVTGGGRGIGRECALAAAKYGAKVLVNDLGGGMASTEDGSIGPAEEVVNEIRAAGGTAAANGGNVAKIEDVAQMVEQAKDELGGLHGVINPAGILRDLTLHKMTEADWDSVLAVHLRGSFNIVKTTIEHFREQREGSYVLFGSTAGLIGNVAQANYAAAKMGIVGLSRVVAIEGQSRNIRSNVLAPFAWTRMMDSVVPQNDEQAARLDRMKKTMRADQVAEFAVALCAPGADISGQIYAVRGDEILLFSQPRPIRSVSRIGGWDVNSILEAGLPSLKPSNIELCVPAAVFPYDPIG